MYLIGSVPPVRCFLRKEYLYNLEKGHNEFIECVWIGITSIYNKALGFRIITKEGVQFNNLPIIAFTTNKNSKQMDISTAELWNCESYDFSVHQFRWLKNKKCDIYLRNKEIVRGQYLFTISFCNSSNQNDPINYAEDSDSKDMHVIELNNGNFVLMPNNRIRWMDFDFITNPFSWKNKPDFKILNQEFNAETGVTRDTDNYIYEIKNAQTKE